MLNSRSEFKRCYIQRLRVEEQDKARELEVLEEQELEEIRETLNDEDGSWEQIKNPARSDSARSSLGVGSSVKREKNGQGAGGRKRRRLKYDVVEDDWGALKEEKTTSEGAGNEECGAEAEMGGEAAPVQSDQPEGATTQPSDELARGAPPRPPPSIPPIQPEGGNGDKVMKMQTGGYD